jgi:hypothetical protein
MSLWTCQCKCARGISYTNEVVALSTSRVACSCLIISATVLIEKPRTVFVEIIEISVITEGRFPTFLFQERLTCRFSRHSTEERMPHT